MITTSRDAFHAYLRSIVGDGVSLYFQPPESLKLTYPAIVYFYSVINNVHADNKVYKQFVGYDVTVIDKTPNSTIAEQISLLPKCRFNRTYIANNLHHFSFTIYH